MKGLGYSNVRLMFQLGRKGDTLLLSVFWLHIIHKKEVMGMEFMQNHKCKQMCEYQYHEAHLFQQMALTSLDVEWKKNP